MIFKNFLSVLASIQNGDLNQQEIIDFASVSQILLSNDSSFLNPDNKPNMTVLLPVYFDFLSSSKIPAREKEINVEKLIKLFPSEADKSKKK